MLARRLMCSSAGRMSSNSSSSYNSSSRWPRRGGGASCSRRVGVVVVVGGGSSSSVRVKVRRLQRLVPGGRRLQPDRLFLQTADYILHLKLKLHFLQAALSKLYKAS
ncbi:hypothetical protein BVC80_8971g54 [Macleaya cordata]|uniref:Myc-type n=1 Tax=Macleaya cordata TaxID=56857 RepID=A0A200R0P2_MACCD|nr:hypothetical protein BVC80_8971g54 [Macleaya cordata]